jgi:hypothetical protein
MGKQADASAFGSACNLSGQICVAPRTPVGYDATVYATPYTQDLGLNSYPLSNPYAVLQVVGYTQRTTKKSWS